MIVIAVTTVGAIRIGRCDVSFCSHKSFFITFSSKYLNGKVIHLCYNFFWPVYFRILKTFSMKQNYFLIRNQMSLIRTQALKSFSFVSVSFNLILNERLFM